MIVGPDGHEPGDARLDRDRVDVRDAQRHVRQPHGLRHRPRRLRGAGHQRQAVHAGRRCASRSTVIRELANGARGRRTRTATCSSRGARAAGSTSTSPRTARRRWRSPARSATASSCSSPTSRIAEWSIAAVRGGGRGGRARPGGGEDLRRRPGVRRRRPRPTSATRCAGSAAWWATTSPTSSSATAPTARRCPQALTDYIAGRKGYDYNEHGRAGNTHTDFVPDEIVDRFCVLGPAEAHIERLIALQATSASTSSRSTCSTTPRTRRSRRTPRRSSRRWSSTPAPRPDARPAPAVRRDGSRAPR